MLASPTVPPSEPISVCAFTLVGAGETHNSPRKCPVDRATSISARSRSAFDARPERALMRFFEAGHDVAAVWLQRHQLACWPVRLPLGARRSGGDECRPVVDHLVGQRLLGRIQRLLSADVQQVAHLERMSGADRER